jgi:hypothetical protein
MISKPTSSLLDTGETVSTVGEMIENLRSLFEEEKEARERHLKPFLEAPSYQLVLQKRQEEADLLANMIQESLLTYLTFPPCHIRHKSKLKEFHRSASYAESVFIMTKFPEGKDEIDIELRRVINAVSKSITDCGFYPRIASDYDYHPQLWDNVELYLLGCSKGVAIVEDHYRPELNPNVSMEWGWMKGMGKEVLYLVENDFKNFRADWSGLTKYNFLWKTPESDIEQAIKKWLKSTT